MRRKNSVYYNRSGYFDPTAGSAIENAEGVSNFYNSVAWKRCRKGFMKSKCYTCERCGDVAVLTHHKQRVKAANVHDSSITLDWGNLEALCFDCHAAEHVTAGATADGISFDADGNVVHSPHI